MCSPKSLAALIAWLKSERIGQIGSMTLTWFFLFYHLFFTNFTQMGVFIYLWWSVFMVLRKLKMKKETRNNSLKTWRHRTLSFGICYVKKSQIRSQEKFPLLYLFSFTRYLGYWTEAVQRSVNSTISWKLNTVMLISAARDKRTFTTLASLPTMTGF